jgi:hypothetical protein
MRAGEAFGLSPFVLMAIASRETNMGGQQIGDSFEWLIRPGDNGHGFGLMQIDSRSFPEWTRLERWRDAREGIFKGAQVLAGKRSAIVEREGQRITVHERNGERWPFVMPPIEGLDLERVAIASYNSGDWAPYHFSKGRDPDRGTTGGNYSADVLERARQFRALSITEAET